MTWMKPLLRRFSEDSGAYAVMYGLLVLALVMSASLVVDLSGLREDRRLERLAADSAATAAAINLNPVAGAVNPNKACMDAWAYVATNLPGASGATPQCPTAKFPTTLSSCPSDVRTATGSLGSFSVTITWPIPNDDPTVQGDSPLLEKPNVTGGGSFVQAPDPAVDGTDPCERIGVAVAKDRQFLLAGIGGNTSGHTSNTSVARADLDGDFLEEYPLVVLDQHGCGVLYAHGSGPQKNQIRVLNNGVSPGRIAVDSAGDLPGTSGYGCDGSGSHTIDVDGGGRVLAYNGTGGAKGLILSFAPLSKSADSTKLCGPSADPSSVSWGMICPIPTQYPRVTRKFWDWQYHCSSSLTAPSAPCPYAPSRPDYIAGIQADLGTLTAANAGSRGFTVWPTTPDASSVCSLSAPFTYVPPGNYFINCGTFNVNHTVVFGGGQVVFRGDLNVQGTGSTMHCLVFNQPIATEPAPVNNDYPQCAPAGSVVTPSPMADMIVYLQKGSLTRQNADFIAPQTFIYQAPSCGPSTPCRIDFGTGTGSNLLLTAPLGGNFKNLTIWSENSAGVSGSGSNPANQLGSQQRLGLEGILFLPNGQVDFQGNPTYIGSARAQFVAYRLQVGGGATLDLTPDKDRTLDLPTGGVRLIR